MIKAVLFDLDGTIANTLQDLADASNYALASFGFPTYETDRYRYFVGRGIPNLIKAIVPKDNGDAETLTAVKAKFFEYYDVHYADNTCVYEGVPQLFETLKAMGIKFAVVTNKAHSAAKEVVKRLYGDTISVVVGQTDDVPVKPSPEMPTSAAKQLGVDTVECLFVGDSGVDCQTGVNCGAVSVGVLWGFRERDELLENGAKYVIDDPNSIIEIIKELNNGK
ncbi:MAG: HAD family hydrolase [Clostridia bacterium]|nr:HAD family hydrolase [Clostridia bacterium]MBQ7106056.1 HAD family hydrolase [Clostridia bacterium]